ncbi:MAG: hypothetical protein U0V74_08090 [Chitinophagales bacterium]
MPQFLRVAVTEPCHEDWNLMSLEDKGRHCQSCNKVVVDFTSMTDAQIVQHFTGYKGHTCGRFRTEQLNRDIRIGTARSSARPVKFLAVSLLAFQLFSNRAVAKDVMTLPDTAQVDAAPVSNATDSVLAVDSCSYEYAWDDSLPLPFKIKFDASYIVCTDITGFTTITLGGASPYIMPVDSTSFDYVISQRQMLYTEENSVSRLWYFVYRYTPLRLFIKQEKFLSIIAAKTGLPGRKSEALLPKPLAILLEGFGLRRKK